MTTVASVYPPVHNMDRFVDYEWISLAEIFESVDSGDFESWYGGLEDKREDVHYPELLESIRENGFYDPVYIRDRANGDRILNNGNHRIAAAVDLGFTHVPFTRDAEEGYNDSSGVTAW